MLMGCVWLWGKGKLRRERIREFMCVCVWWLCTKGLWSRNKTVYSTVYSSLFCWVWNVIDKICFVGNSSLSSNLSKTLIQLNMSLTHQIIFFFYFGNVCYLLRFTSSYSFGSHVTYVLLELIFCIADYSIEVYSVTMVVLQVKIIVSVWYIFAKDDNIFLLPIL